MRVPWGTDRRARRGLGSAGALRRNTTRLSQRSRKKAPARMARGFAAQGSARRLAVCPLASNTLRCCSTPPASNTPPHAAFAASLYRIREQSLK